MAARKTRKPTERQLAWLRRGLAQPGGKLPLYDEGGQRVNAQTVRSCIERGWAEPWFANPIKQDMLVCKLTDTGWKLADDKERAVREKSQSKSSD